MIDTIVLLLKHDMFTIMEPNRFEPSANWIKDDTLSLGGRGYTPSKQNPTKAELKNGIYKPRLTLTKRTVGYSKYEITLKIEFSIPKLIFGNNFDELEDSDFDKVIQTLKTKLREMGVFIFEKRLTNAHVSSIHYSKNIPLLDYTTPYTYLERLSKINMNQRLDLSQTEFRNGGHILKYRANSFEIAFYDKLKDLNKAKISEKRAEEKDNTTQLNLFSNRIIQKPFEVLRMEIRLNKRAKLIQILKKLNISPEPTFKLLFKKETARQVLLYYIEQMESEYPKILTYDFVSAKEFLFSFMFNNPNAGIKKSIQMVGLRSLFEEVGVREFREITKKFNPNSWYTLNSELESLVYPKQVDTFSLLKTTIEEFKPLRLTDYQKERRS